MREPFILKESILWHESWMNHNFKLTSGITTNKNGNQVGDFKGLNVAYHVGDNPKNVLKNRQYIANILKLPLDRWVFAQQLHTTHIHKVTSVDLGAGVKDFNSGIPATDGLYTTEANIVLATFYADCTPLYFYVPNHCLVGIAHAGWRGTINGMMHKMLQTLKEVEGVKSNEIFIAIGPCIGRDAYRVDDQVLNQVLKSPMSGISETFVDLGNGQYKFDLKLLNYFQALHEGVPVENITISSYCTHTDCDLFYSHRRNPKTGRMMSFISLKE